MISKELTGLFLIFFLHDSYSKKPMLVFHTFYHTPCLVSDLLITSAIHFSSLFQNNNKEIAYSFYLIS